MTNDKSKWIDCTPTLQPVRQPSKREMLSLPIGDLDFCAWPETDVPFTIHGHPFASSQERDAAAAKRELMQRLAEQFSESAAILRGMLTEEEVHDG